MKHITFDFDSTCTVPMWDANDGPDDHPDLCSGMWVPTFSPRTKIIAIMHDLVRTGHRVSIVTSAPRIASGAPQFVKDFGLPVTDVFFADCDKIHMLQQIGSDLHFDDDVMTLNILNRGGINTVWVQHPFDVTHNIIPVIATVALDDNDFDTFFQLQLDS